MQPVLLQWSLLHKSRFSDVVFGPMAEELPPLAGDGPIVDNHEDAIAPPQVDSNSHQQSMPPPQQQHESQPQRYYRYPSALPRMHCIAALSNPFSLDLLPCTVAPPKLNSTSEISHLRYVNDSACLTHVCTLSPRLPSLGCSSTH